MASARTHSDRQAVRQDGYGKTRRVIDFMFAIEFFDRSDTVNQGYRRVDITPWVFAIAILSLIHFIGHNVSAQDLEVAPRIKEPYLNRIVIDGNESFSDKDLKGLQCLAQQ